MSSYLADLAARSLGQLAVARPRLASRFEPIASGPSAVAAPQPDADAHVEAIERPRIAAARTAFNAVDRQPDGINTRDQSGPVGTRRHRHAIADLRDAMQPAAPKPLQKPPPEIPIAIVPRVADAAPAPPARRDVVVWPRIADGAAASTRSDVDHETHTIVRAPARDDSRWQSADERLSALERRLAARDRARVEPSPHAAARSDSIAPRPVPRDQPAPQPHRAAQATLDDARPQEAPAVHVTIGRIDVRAITLPPSSRPARRQAPPRPSLSLDQYLKQRSSR